MRGNNTNEATLDLCLDRFLSGGEWRSVLSPDDPAEVGELMEVAELVLAIARRTPPIEAPAKQRLWNRLMNRFSEIRPLAPFRQPHLAAEGAQEREALA